jgi:hypothetical protein
LDFIDQLLLKVLRHRRDKHAGLLVWPGNLPWAYDVGLVVLRAVIGAGEDA